MKYRIVNRRRFIAFSAFALLLIAFILIPAIHPAVAKDGEMLCTEYTVESGDTLWGIAKSFGPKAVDIRETVFRIEQLNGVKAGEIYPGQTLLIPCL